LAVIEEVGGGDGGRWLGPKGRSQQRRGRAEGEEDAVARRGIRSCAYPLSCNWSCDMGVPSESGRIVCCVHQLKKKHNDHIAQNMI
jgi:hypothetical protein